MGIVFWPLAALSPLLLDDIPLCSSAHSAVRTQTASCICAGARQAATPNADRSCCNLGGAEMRFFSCPKVTASKIANMEGRNKSRRYVEPLTDFSRFGLVKKERKDVYGDLFLAMRTAKEINHQPGAKCYRCS